MRTAQPQYANADLRVMQVVAIISQQEMCLRAWKNYSIVTITSHHDDYPYSRPRKQRVSHSQASFYLLEWENAKEIQQMEEEPLPLKTGQKASKKKLKNKLSVVYQQPELSNSDSLPDSSPSGEEYRALRRKYLLLEEESFALGTELREVEDEVKTLEEKNTALLD